jgi:hypothetical protein
MNNLQKERDDFENALFYFMEALNVLELNAESQCEQMGNYNVPWELRHDVSEGGMAVTRSSASYLTREQTDQIIELASKVRELPAEATAPAGTPTTNHPGSLIAMNHASWAPLREKAAQLLRVLEPASKRNKEYFDHAARYQDAPNP